MGLKVNLKVKSLNHVQLFATLWTVAYQAPPSMGFSKQEYWSGLPFPYPGIFPTQGSNLGLHIGGRHFNLWATCLQCRRPRFDSWVGKICWRKDRLPTPVFLGFPCGLAGKDSTCNVGHLGSVSGLVRSPGEGKDYPIQYSGLENSMDCRVHGVTKSWTRLRSFHFHGLGFCVIISSNNLPAYFCFYLEYGQISSK